MTTNDIEQIASNAIMIVCGYAFMKEMYIKWSLMSNQGFYKGE